MKTFKSMALSSQKKRANCSGLLAFVHPILIGGFARSIALNINENAGAIGFADRDTHGLKSSWRFM